MIDTLQEQHDRIADVVRIRGCFIKRERGMHPLQFLNVLLEN